MLPFSDEVFDQSLSQLVLHFVPAPVSAIGELRRALDVDPSDSIVLYNVACNYAIMGRVEDSLEYLEHVVENGTVSLDWMRNDSDLESLHGHPRYEALLAQVSN